MAAAPDPADEALAAPIGSSSTDDALDAPHRRHRLGRRAIAICLVVALLASIFAGLITSIVLSNTATSEAEAELTLSSSAIDEDRLLDAVLLTVDAAPTALRDHLGDDRTLVNLWQSTCAPCIKEMPLLDAVPATNPDVTVIGVATQDRLADAKALAAQTKVTYPWFQDPLGDLYYETRGTGMPTTLLLAANGRVLASETGAFANAAELQAFLDRHPG